MKIFLIYSIIILFGISNFTIAQTNKSGPISSSETWGPPEDTHYRITGNVTINSGVTVTISSGVTVDYTGNFRILVNGTLTAQGTITDSIIFKHETASNSHASIDIINTSAETASTLEYCRIQDGAASVFTSNAYTWSGGAIFIEDSDPTIKHCLLKGNTALSGGAIKINNNTTTTIESNVIRNNTSTSGSTGGGGIACTGLSGTTAHNPVIANNLIYDNTANRNGGAFYMTDASGGNMNVTLHNNVLYNNTALTSAGGIYHGAGNIFTDLGSIYWANSPSQLSGGGSPALTYCNVQGGYTGTGNINSDPLFIDVTNRDFHLSPNSPCIDTVFSASVSSTDFDENPTNQDGNNTVNTMEYDMGAFEFLQDVQTSFTNGVATNYIVDTFESGTSNTIASITLNGTISGTGSITVNCFTKTNPLNDPLGSKSVKRWYRISQTGNLSAATDVDLQLNYSDEEFDMSNLTETGLTLWKYSGGNWINQGGVVTTGSNYVTISGLSAVSDLTGDWAFADANDNPLPVTLYSFDAVLIKDGIDINWVTGSEIDNMGFELWKRNSNDEEYTLLTSYKNNIDLIGLGNSANGKNYQYIDTEFFSSQSYEYKLSSIDFNGSYHNYGTVAVNTENFVENFIISANYPNPFNPETRFDVQLNEPSELYFEIYNVLGEKVDDIKSVIRNSGTSQVIWSGNSYPSGVYFYRIFEKSLQSRNGESERNFVKSGRMVLLR